MAKYRNGLFAFLACLAMSALNGKTGPYDLMQGWNALDRMDWTSAAAHFRRAVDMEETSPASRAEALYGLGLSYGYANPPQVVEALAAFAQITKDYSSADCASWAALESVLLRGRAGDIDSLAEADELLEVAARHRGHAVVHEATIRAAMSLLEAGQGERSAKLLNDHLRQYPDNAEAPLMRFLIAYWKMEIDEDYEGALPILLELAEHNLAEPRRRAMIMWSIAQIYRLHRDDPQTALVWYRRIVEEFPNEITTGDARRMIRQLEQAQ